jgi:hypothetical protein
MVKKGRDCKVTSVNILDRLSYSYSHTQLSEIFPDDSESSDSCPDGFATREVPPYPLGQKLREPEIRSRSSGEEIYISYLFRVSNP